MANETILPERKRKHKNKELSPSKKRKHATTTTTATTATTGSEDVSKHVNGTTHVVSTTPSSGGGSSAATDADSPFRLINATLYVPLSPISISPTHASASLIAEHLAPLLLTYYPPFKGIVLAYSNASISETAPTSTNINSHTNSQNSSNTSSGSSFTAPLSSQSLNFDNPKPLTLALTANEYGVLYLYLTATFLIFSPQKGHVLEGWVNVQSEGFVGAIAYNLFSVGIERKRTPKTWKWIPPGTEEDEDDDGEVEGVAKKSKIQKGYVSATSGDEDGDKTNKLAFDSEKEHFTPLPRNISRPSIKPSSDLDTNMLGEEFGAYDEDDEDADEDSNSTGYFQSVSGHRVRGTIRFRVRDVDVVPGADPDRGFLSIEGTMLTPEEEAQLEQEERDGPLPAHRQREAYAMTGSGALPTSQTRTAASDNDVAEIHLAETIPSNRKLEAKDDKKKKSKDKSKSKKKD